MRALILTHPQDGDALVVVRNTSVVGRGSDADIDLRTRTVSRRHALLDSDGKVWFLSDLESKNGTAVNGSTVKDEAVPLIEGDVVSFGGVTYGVRFGDEESTD